MPTLENLKTHIGTINLLQSVVRTMKTLAAVSLRHQEKVIQSLTDYARTVDMGLMILLHEGVDEIDEQRLQSDGKLGVIILGSDQGLCGRFNEQVASFAWEQLQALEPEALRRQILCVGNRAETSFVELGGTVHNSLSAPVSITGITPAVNSLLVVIDQWNSNYSVKRVVLFHNLLLAGTNCRPELLRLLPFDHARLLELASQPWPSKTIPRYSMARKQLFSCLFRHSLFASLYRVLAVSMAAENASRLAAMQAAEKNIGERLDELNRQFRDLRQGVITEEVLDIVAGFEAMTSKRR
ncbi:MAG: F0F1 ATP synthase subunit gamma [Geobacteraceae bacterium]